MILCLFTILLTTDLFIINSKPAKRQTSLFSQYTPEYGFSSIKGSLGTVSCFIPDQITYHNKDKVKFNQPYSYVELLDKLSLTNEINFPSYLFQGDELAQFLNYIKPTELSTSLSFIASLHQKVSLRYKTSSAGDFINKQGLILLSKSQSDFYDLCGDQLVESYDVGIFLLVSLNLLFHTVDEKEQFIRQIENIQSELNVASVFNQINRISRSSYFKGVIELKAIQLGGTDNAVNKEITSCLFNNIEKCQAKFEEVTKYLLSFYPQYEAIPLTRQPLTRFNKKYVSEMYQEFTKPLYSFTESETTIRTQLMLNYNKYSYYDRFLTNFQYYPIQIDSISNCLSKVKDNLMKLTLSEPLRCFEDHTLCSQYDLVLKSLDETIEEKILSLLEKVKTYDIITIYLKDDLFLNGDGTANLPKFQWDAEYPVYIYILPVDKNVFKWKVESEVFEVETSSDIVTDLNKIEFTVNEGFFKFKVTLQRNYKNESEFKVLFNEEEKKIIKQLKIPLINQANPFYFPKYNE